MVDFEQIFGDFDGSIIQKVSFCVVVNDDLVGNMSIADHFETYFINDFYMILYVLS